MLIASEKLTDFNDQWKTVPANHLILVNTDYSIQIEPISIVKYTAAMKAGHADPESILRRFNQNNLKHPPYMALSQLGKVLKTIFICNYLMHESIR